MSVKGLLYLKFNNSMKIAVRHPCPTSNYLLLHRMGTSDGTDTALSRPPLACGGDGQVSVENI